MIEGKEIKKPSMAMYRLVLEDTPKNRKRIGRKTQEWISAINEGRDIGFGVGLRNGKIVLEADNLDLIPPGMRREKKRS